MLAVGSSSLPAVPGVGQGQAWNFVARDRIQVYHFMLPLLTPPRRVTRHNEQASRQGLASPACSPTTARERRRLVRRGANVRERSTARACSPGQRGTHAATASGRATATGFQASPGCTTQGCGIRMRVLTKPSCRVLRASFRPHCHGRAKDWCKPPRGNMVRLRLAPQTVGEGARPETHKATTCDWHGPGSGTGTMSPMVWPRRQSWTWRSTSR